MAWIGNFILFAIALGLLGFLYTFVWGTINTSLFFFKTPKAREVVTVINHGLNGAFFGLLTYLITIHFTESIKWAWVFELAGMLNCMSLARGTQKPGVIILSGVGGLILSFYVFDGIVGFGISFLVAVTLAIPYNLTKLNFMLESQGKELRER